jgi:hypothetical protein
MNATGTPPTTTSHVRRFALVAILVTVMYIALMVFVPWEATIIKVLFVVPLWPLFKPLAQQFPWIVPEPFRRWESGGLGFYVILNGLAWGALTFTFLVARERRRPSSPRHPGGDPL